MSILYPYETFVRNVMLKLYYSCILASNKNREHKKETLGSFDVSKIRFYPCNLFLFL